MEFIKGKTLGEMLEENMEQAAYYMNMSIDKQLEVHRMRTDKLEPMSDKLSRQIKSATQLAQRQKSVLLQKLNATTYEKKIMSWRFSFV